MLLLTAFDQILVVEDLYVAFSHNRKRSKGRKNKSEGYTLAMSALQCAKDCGPLKRTGIHVTTPAKAVF